MLLFYNSKIEVKSYNTSTALILKISKRKTIIKRKRKSFIHLRVIIKNLSAVRGKLIIEEP